jgi:hypothetical protein
MRGAVENVFKIFPLENITILLLWLFHRGITPRHQANNFCEFKPYAKFRNPRTPLLGERFVWVEGGWMVGRWGGGGWWVGGGRVGGWEGGWVLGVLTRSVY